MSDAQIIDMFTRRPIPEVTSNLPGYVRAEQVRADFAEMARNGVADLDPEDEEWFITTFKDFYLAEFMDCARGIEEADTVADLEHFLRRAQDQMKEWPDLVRS